jgi:F-type H+-transporting ATPase subunit epsilon
MHLEIVTPAGTALATDADEVVAPGVRGEFGVLPGHTPLLSGLKAGVLVWRAVKGGRSGVLAVGPGYAEVDGHDRIVVLTQEAVTAEQIDVAAARQELEQAERALKESASTDAEARRAWAQARIDARATTGA